MKLLPTCQEVQERLTDYDEGTLPMHQALGYWLHLFICRACQATYRGLKAIPVLGKALLSEQESLSGDTTDRIMTRLMKSLKDHGHAHPHG